MLHLLEGFALSFTKLSAHAGAEEAADVTVCAWPWRVLPHLRSAWWNAALWSPRMTSACCLNAKDDDVQELIERKPLALVRTTTA